MRTGIDAACRDGVVAISAGNYGGKLGPHHFYLRKIMSGAVRSEWSLAKLKGPLQSTGGFRPRCWPAPGLPSRRESSPDVRCTWSATAARASAISSSWTAAPRGGSASWASSIRPTAWAQGSREGEVIVEGSVGREAGLAQAGGRLDINGDAGPRAGAAPLGFKRGMTGGELIVRGSAGAEAGAAMRRGLLVILRAAGDRTGLGMIAGTVVVFGAVGADTGPVVQTRLSSGSRPGHAAADVLLRLHLPAGVPAAAAHPVALQLWTAGSATTPQRLLSPLQRRHGRVRQGRDPRMDSK